MTSTAPKVRVVYLLHFHEKLSHAGHYVGQTTNLVSRMDQHRAGVGARITQVVNDKGGWSLVAAWQPRGKAWERNHERALKNQKSAAEFCPLCSEAPRVPQGMIDYPIPAEG